MPNESERNSSGVKIRRGKLGSISLYEVTEDELSLLEHGSPASIYLNFAIGLLSTGVSFLINIFSTKIENMRVYIVFWVVALVTTIAGVVLLAVWRQANKATENVIQRIKKQNEPNDAQHNAYLGTIDLATSRQLITAINLKLDTMSQISVDFFQIYQNFRSPWCSVSVPKTLLKRSAFN